MGLEELYLQSGTVPTKGAVNMLTMQRTQILNSYQWLVEEVMALEEDRFPRYPALDGMASVIILPQIHALLWGNERGK